MTLRELSRITGIPYSSVRKYVLALKDAGILEVETGPNGMAIPDEAVRIVKKVARLVSKGYRLKLAIETVKYGDEDLLKEILELEMEILEELKKIRKALEKPGIFERIFRWRKNP